MIIIIHSKWIDSSIWHMDGILTGCTIPGQSGPASDDNKGVLPIPPNP